MNGLYRLQHAQDRHISGDNSPLEDARFVLILKLLEGIRGIYGKTLLGSFQNGMDSFRPTRPMICHPALK